MTGGGGASLQVLLAPASFERLPQLRTVVAACWQHNSLRRPTAQAVARTLGALLQSHLAAAGAAGLVGPPPGASAPATPGAAAS